MMLVGAFLIVVELSGVGILVAYLTEQMLLIDLLLHYAAIDRIDKGGLAAGGHTYEGYDGLRHHAGIEGYV